MADKLALILGIGLTALNIGVLVAKPLLQTFTEWKTRGRKIQNDYHSINDLEEMAREDKMFILLILNHLIN